MLLYRLWLLLAVLCISGKVSAQELFVYTEPASNMPAKSVGIRASNWLMNDANAGKINYHFIPELMWGVNRSLMIHAEGFISNRTGGLTTEGGALYVKYRFFSRDKVYQHLRMAVFGRASTNNGDIHQQEIATNGHNTGYQAGLITTQLLHKTALSVTAYYEHALDNFGNNHELPVSTATNAVNYSFSAGRLILPKKYIGYKQTNMNLMVEILGQSQPEQGRHYVDAAPSVQFIFNSQTRVDVGYRFELYSNMLRTAPNGFMIRAEHLLFNVL